MRGTTIAAIAFFAIASTSAIAADPTARLVDVRGSRLYVETEGSGPPIVFLHGGLQYFDNTYKAQRAYFAAFRQVIGIDQAGHGHSPDDGKPFSYRKMADDVAAVIEQLGVGRSTWSAGAMGATSACCSHAIIRSSCVASSSPAPT